MTENNSDITEESSCALKFWTFRYALYWLITTNKSWTIMFKTTGESLAPKNCSWAIYVSYSISWMSPFSAVNVSVKGKVAAIWSSRDSPSARSVCSSSILMLYSSIEAENSLTCKSPTTHASKVTVWLRGASDKNEGSPWSFWKEEKENWLKH